MKAFLLTLLVAAAVSVPLKHKSQDNVEVPEAKPDVDGIVVEPQVPELTPVEPEDPIVPIPEPGQSEPDELIVPEPVKPEEPEVPEPAPVKPEESPVPEPEPVYPEPEEPIVPDLVNPEEPVFPEPAPGPPIIPVPEPVYPEPGQPGIPDPEPAVPSPEINPNEVYNDGLVQVHVNAEPTMLETLQSWISVVLNYFSGSSEVSQQIV